jgi:hypothetical protein
VQTDPYLLQQMREVYEARIADLKEEIQFLRGLLERR